MENDKDVNSNSISKIDNLRNKIVKLINRSGLGNRKTNPLKRGLNFLSKYKFPIGGAVFSVLLIVFVGVAIYRGYFLTSANTQTTKSHSTTMSKTNNDIASDGQKPSLAAPSPSNNPSPSDSNVLGTSDDSNSDETNDAAISPTVEISPIPTEVPEPTETPTDTTNDISSSTNSNCTTGSGVPNSWYSDVYPVSPVSASNGSATLTVNIRDCSINNVSSSSTLKISLNSGDPDAQVNGQSLPATISTQNGQASFTVSSQINGTVILAIQDTTDSFTITDTSNSNPSIVFDGSSSAPTPTDEISPAPTSDISQTPTDEPTISPTP
jgi:hypothetical protein